MRRLYHFIVFFLLISASLLYIPISASGSTFDLGAAAYSPDSNITQDGYVHLSGSPFGLAYDQDNGNIYAAVKSANQVSVITNKAISATVKSIITPINVFFDPSNGYVYASLLFPNKVSVISRTNTIEENISVGNGPMCMGLDNSTGNLYVTDSCSGNVSVISETNHVIATVKVGNYPNGIAYDSNNGELYVANRDSGSYAVIEGSNNLELTTVNVSSISNETSLPQRIVYDPQNQMFYFANNGSRYVLEYSPQNESVVKAIYIGPFDAPCALLYVPSLKEIFLANGANDTIIIISTQNNSVIGSISVGREPTGLAYDPGNRYLYVSISHADEIEIFSIDNASQKIGISTSSLSVYYELGGVAVVVLLGAVVISMRRKKL